MQSEALESFTGFMNLRAQAALAYVSGDGAKLAQILAPSDPASFFAPRGGVTHGAEQVAARYAADVGAFAPGSQGKLEILHMEASGDLAYWVGFQHASARMKGRDQPLPFHLRITEVFRREGGTWKLVHRHADTAVEAQP